MTVPDFGTLLRLLNIAFVLVVPVFADNPHQG
jgi:hypothetical protein